MTMVELRRIAATHLEPDNRWRNGFHGFTEHYRIRVEVPSTLLPCIVAANDTVSITVELEHPHSLASNVISGLKTFEIGESFSRVRAAEPSLANKVRAEWAIRKALSVRLIGCRFCFVFYGMSRSLR